MFKLLFGSLPLFSLLILVSPSFAQMRGQDSSEFFRQGQEQLNQEIEQMENQREQEEENLEQTLEIKQPKKPEVEEVPDNPESLDDNLPEATEDEVEVKF
jgi:hypothetical protein